MYGKILPEFCLSKVIVYRLLKVPSIFVSVSKIRFVISDRVNQFIRKFSEVTYNTLTSDFI